MSKVKSQQRNVHYNASIKQLTIDMWLSGKSEYEINKAIRAHIAKMRRNRKTRTPAQS